MNIIDYACCLCATPVFPLNDFETGGVYGRHTKAQKMSLKYKHTATTLKIFYEVKSMKAKLSLLDCMLHNLNRRSIC